MSRPRVRIKICCIATVAEARLAIEAGADVSGPDRLDEARGVAPQLDALLLDSGNQALAVKELGGTGRVHDWDLSRAIRGGHGAPADPWEKWPVTT